MNFAVLRISKLRSKARVTGALNHAFRERPTLNADPNKLRLNTVMGADSTAAAQSAIDARIALVTPTAIAKDAVVCIEYLISASPSGMSTKSRAEQDAYLNDALDWIKQKHGAENVVCAIVHRDEGTCAHLSAFVVPLVQAPLGSRKRSVIAGTNADGSKRREIRVYPVPAVVRLSATHYFPDAAALSEMQTDFAERVGVKHGFMRGIKGSKRKHERVARGYALEAMADLAPIMVPILSPRSRFSINPEVDRERDQEMVEREFRALETQRNILAQQVAVARRSSMQHENDLSSLRREREEIRRERHAILVERQKLIERAQQAEAAALNWREWAVLVLEKIVQLKSLDSIRVLIQRTFEALGIDDRVATSRSKNVETHFRGTSQHGPQGWSPGDQ